MLGGWLSVVLNQKRAEDDMRKQERHSGTILHVLGNVRPNLRIVLDLVELFLRTAHEVQSRNHICKCRHQGTFDHVLWLGGTIEDCATLLCLAIVSQVMMTNLKNQHFSLDSRCHSDVRVVTYGFIQLSLIERLHLQDVVYHLFDLVLARLGEVVAMVV